MTVSAVQPICLRARHHTSHAEVFGGAHPPDRLARHSARQLSLGARYHGSLGNGLRAAARPSLRPSPSRLWPSRNARRDGRGFSGEQGLGVA